jgi:N-acetylmuramoyl-L-alanine amidase
MRRWWSFVAVILLGVVIPTSLARLMEEKRLAVFTTEGKFTLMVSEREGEEYVVLNDLLERMGRLDISASQQGTHLRFNSIDAEFENEQSTATVGGKSLALGAKAFIENNRVLIPLSSCNSLLPALVNVRVDYHAGSRRLFLGGTGRRFALELRKGDTTQLVLSFELPVSPQIDTEPGKLRIVFKREPIAMSSQKWQFEDGVITSASYTDSAEPELTIVGSQPLLATFENSGKTIAVMPAPRLSSPATNVPTPAPVPAAAAQRGSSSISAPTRSAIEPLPGSHGSPQDNYLIVIDPAHGGADRGAALGQRLDEKDVTLAIARRLRKQLEDHGLTCLMVRDSDTTLALDQRATLANTSQAKIYIAIHAAGLGRGIRVYTSSLAPSPAELFAPWEKAQASFVQNSRTLAAVVLDELGKNQVPVPPGPFPAAVRPLNNVTAPAVAIEVGPMREDVETVNNSTYQDAIANALASAVASMHSRMESQK